MSWWLPDYEPSDHEIEIEKLYEIVDAGRRDYPAGRTLIICFTNRSGSTFLGEALASTGSVKLAGEFMNHPVIKSQSDQRDVTSLDAYLIDLAERYTHRGIFSLKAGLYQLYYLARLGFLGDLLTRPIYVLIERDDILAQAVSWALAVQTGQWLSTQDTVDPEPEYSFSLIDRRIDTILAENAAFRAFFARNDCDAEFVTYERLRSDPSQAVAELAKALSLDRLEYNPARVKIAPQRSGVTAEWKARYLEEVRSQ